MKKFLAVAVLAFWLGACDTPENTTGTDETMSSPPVTTDTSTTMPVDTVTNRPDSLR